MARAKIGLLISICLALVFPKNVLAQECCQFVTVVNPVRIAPYTTDVSENLKHQYALVNRFNFPATWLVTYGILENAEAIDIIKSFDSKQEIGLFLEIGPQVSGSSGVELNSGNWHDPSVIFLSGYVQEDRRKLIDTYFEKFKSIFGTYPKTVGSWWTDAYSLGYMHDKYGIVTNLGVTDQFSTDSYRIWGTYWSTPFISSKYHAGMPAQSAETSSQVLTIQWAAREPIQGYQSSLYSTQDYFVLNPPKQIGYFEDLLKTYALKTDENQFGHMVVGLESDLGPESYQLNSNLGQQLSVVKKYVDSSEIEVLTANEFSAWYFEKFPTVSPVHTVVTDEVTWYNSPEYRIGSKEQNGQIEIFDFRVYLNNFYEPFYEVPNKSNFLNINIPAIVDTVTNSDEAIFVENIDEEVQKHLNLEVEEYSFYNLSPEATHMLQSKKLILFLIIFTTIIFVLFIKYKKLRLKIFILALLLIISFFIKNMQVYSVPQEEVFALFKLENLEEGKVLVFNQECLQCDSYNKNKIAAFYNKREYVNKLSKKKIVYTPETLNNVSRENAKGYFKKLGVKYIYLTRYANYREELPYSPGDWSVELIFDNAHSQIWKVI